MPGIRKLINPRFLGPYHRIYAVVLPGLCGRNKGLAALKAKYTLYIKEIMHFFLRKIQHCMPSPAEMISRACTSSCLSSGGGKELDRIL